VTIKQESSHAAPIFQNIANVLKTLCTGPMLWLIILPASIQA